MVEHYLDTVGVGSSILPAPTRVAAKSGHGRGDVSIHHPSVLAARGLVFCGESSRNRGRVGDRAVEPGGCIVDVGECRIDAQIGTAIERLRSAWA